MSMLTLLLRNVHMNDLALASLAAKVVLVVRGLIHLCIMPSDSAAYDLLIVLGPTLLVFVALVVLLTRQRRRGATP